METGFGLLFALLFNFNICECQSMNMSSRGMEEIKKFIHKNSPFNPLRGRIEK